MKTPRNISSVLFALDQGFGALRTDTIRNVVKVLGLDLEPASSAAFQLLRSRQIRTGLLLPESFDSRVAKELRGFLPDITIVKCRGQNLSRALKSFFDKPEEGLFVAADRFCRGHAAALRIVSLPHPALVATTLEHNNLLFVKAIGSKNQM
ncbi:MAG TPA: hypothetical protein PK228_03995, partial [Saprospiraceae bacterium]|nr:hypothetical protein [Saprospiraceae bacterium]